MSYCQEIYQYISKCCDNYTWFSMVAMNGEECDRRYKDYKLSKKKPVITGYNFFYTLKKNMTKNYKNFECSKV